MGQALYRKYRSKSLDEVIGQEHVTSTLKNALKQGRISHAYLLSGPRGVGKTSIARILAHEVNDLPYDDEAHLDIIEIDAASNRRIDEIRELRDRVNTAPAHAKYKVYIIDEVHMLTREAFNALLKTLEEPPAHVIFILATTEAHKLPETIISRTQRYSLRPVPSEQVVQHLRTIAQQEKLPIDDDALQLIAQHGEGSLRDSISLLDQAGSMGQRVTQADVERILGLAPAEHISRLLAAMETGDSTLIVTSLQELYDLGYEAAMVATQLGSILRESIVTATAKQPQADLHLLQQLLEVPAARSARHLLEIILLEKTLPPDTTTPHLHTAEPSVAHKSKEATPLQPAAKQAPVTPAPVRKETAAIEENEKDSAIDISKQPELHDATELWQETLNQIKKRYNTLYGIARMAKPEFDGETLTLAFKFAFHQKRMNEAKNRKIFAEVVEKLYGKPVEITCIIGKPTEGAKPDVSAISNIFGGAELLES